MSAPKPQSPHDRGSLVGREVIQYVQEPGQAVAAGVFIAGFDFDAKH